MKTILVTGGAGFIGSNLVRFLLRERPDWNIVNVDGLTYAGNTENNADVQDNPRYHWSHTDITDRAALRTVFEQYQPDGVIHCAAETHVDRSIKDSDPFVSTNIIGTQNLLVLSRQFGVQRYHQVSTDEVYGDLGDGSTHFFTEQTPLAPNCPYAATKAAADLLVQSWNETYGMSTVITRCSNNYGPYQYPEKLIPFLLHRTINGETLPLYGDGLHIRDWLYVEDHCEAILVAFERSPSGRVWNIGGHNEKTNQSIAQLIQQFVPNTGSEITYVEDRKAHDRRYAMDASLIQAELGWTPKHTFEEALPKTITWYTQNQPWVERCLARTQSLEADKPTA